MKRLRLLTSSLVLLALPLAGCRSTTSVQPVPTPNAATSAAPAFTAAELSSPMGSWALVSPEPQPTCSGGWVHFNPDGSGQFESMSMGRFRWTYDPANRLVNSLVEHGPNRVDRRLYRLSSDGMTMISLPTYERPPGLPRLGAPPPERSSYLLRTHRPKPAHLR